MNSQDRADDLCKRMGGGNAAKEIAEQALSQVTARPTKKVESALHKGVDSDKVGRPAKKIGKAVRTVMSKMKEASMPVPSICGKGKAKSKRKGKR